MIGQVSVACPTKRSQPPLQSSSIAVPLNCDQAVLLPLLFGRQGEKDAWYIHLKHHLPVVFPPPLTHLIAGYSPSCTFDIIFQVLQKSSKFGLNKLVMIEELAMWF